MNKKNDKVASSPDLAKEAEANTDCDCAAGLYTALGGSTNETYLFWATWDLNYPDHLRKAFVEIDSKLSDYGIKVWAKLMCDDLSKLYWKVVRSDEPTKFHVTDYTASENFVYYDLAFFLREWVSHIQDQEWFDKICEEAFKQGVLVGTRSMVGKPTVLTVCCGTEKVEVCRDRIDWKVKLTNAIEYCAACQNIKDVASLLLEDGFILEMSEDGKSFKIPWALRGYFLRLMYEGSPGDVEAVDINKLEWVPMTNRNLHYLKQALSKFMISKLSKSKPSSENPNTPST